MRAAELYKVIPLVLPGTNLQVNPTASPWFSLKNYPWMSFWIVFNAGTGTGPTITVEQAKNVNGQGAKSLTLYEAWKSNPTLTGDQDDLWSRFTISNSAFVGVASTAYLVDIKAASLDATNNYDCVKLLLSSTNQSFFTSAAAWLWGGRYIGEGHRNMGPALATN